MMEDRMMLTIPHRISATCNAITDCAVKKIAVNPIMSTKHVMTV